MQEKRLRSIIFVILTFLTWLLYFKTTAPTVVFWDVGEFLASSYILGIPHPPGTPLYVILGKFFSLLPLPMAFFYRLLNGGHPVESVLRITMISMLSGAFTVGFGYLVIARLLRKWDPKVPGFIVHLSAIFGALVGAVAVTVWMNSIEAETYSPSVAVMVFLTWVGLNWYDKRDDAKSLRYLLFALYFLFLSSGIHLMPLIFFPALFIFVWAVKPKLIWDLEFLAIIAISFMIITLIKLTYEPTRGAVFMHILAYLVLLWYLRLRNLLDFDNIWVMGYLIGGLLIVIGLISSGALFLFVAGTFLAFISLYMRADLHKEWKGFALILIVLALTTEFYMIVRAHHQPRINEADPGNWKAFWDVLFRKQYEPAKIFPRRIPFPDQFRLFWLYYTWQYFGSLTFIIPLLGIIGFVMHYFEDRKTFALVGTAMLMGSLGLIIYLNLKDSPTHPIHSFNPREVRDRDYFFAPAYTYIGFYAGIGLWEILKLLLENVKNRLIPIVTGLVISIAILGYQTATAYPRVDRSKNYIAEDYAYNMLISPRGKSVMYTNGDNDTFPLWFDQEVLGVRRDVIIANLSLLNTNWYIKQLKSWGAPISFSMSEIDSLPPFFRTEWGGMLLRDFMIRDMLATSAGYKADSFYYLYGGSIKFPRIYLAPKDKFLKEVIDGANFKIPIYFALTVARDVYNGWQDHFKMEGLAFRVVPYKASPAGIPGMEGIDVERTRRLLHNDMPPDEFLKLYKDTLPPDGVFRYRGVFDPSVFKDGNHIKLVRNYAASALRLGLYLNQMGRKEEAAQEFDFANKLLYQIIYMADHFGLKDEDLKGLPEIRNQIIAISQRLADLYRELGKYELATKTVREALDLEKTGTLYTEMAMIYRDMGEIDSSILYFRIAKDLSPREPANYLGLHETYLAKGDTENAIDILDQWLKINPRDRAAESLKVELERKYSKSQRKGG